ncbi:hypothetical protein CAPN002_06160 [Capnocytophaga stomatis]|uniref:hypothetical protein n=1 Tax=Capnocytophaga stomatis TaxID=1848904 RepID=UPI00194F20DE|nr:hypothetical protein [Capnocytophaga stomatis]GIJ93398.1 hypothetical protein CAPN002_06160 [Capnocytophaga stomatis]
MIRIENVEQGKYYADKNSALRVDGFDHFGNPIGLSVVAFDGCVDIYQNTDLDFHFLDDNKMKEITRAKFELRLKEAQKRFTQMINSELLNVVS